MIEPENLRSAAAVAEPANAQRPDDLNVVDRPGDNIPLTLLLQLSVFTVVGALLLVLAPEGPWSVRLLIIALVFMTLKRWGGVLVLILVQGDLLLREGREFAGLQGVTGILFVFVVVAVLMFVARNRQLLQQTASSSLFRQAKTLLNAPAATGDNLTEADSSAVALRIFASGLRALFILHGCVAISAILIAMLPDNRELTRSLRSAVDADPPMVVGAAIFVAIIAAWIVVSEISWRQMTPSQARMYQRSIFVKLHYRDLRMVVLRRLKLRRRRLAATSSQKNNDTQTTTAGGVTATRWNPDSKWD